ncbi:hypothetical protein STEG23_027553, partial [Scotinomys teguina]
MLMKGSYIHGPEAFHGGMDDESQIAVWKDSGEESKESTETDICDNFCFQTGLRDKECPIPWNGGYRQHVLGKKHGPLEKQPVLLMTESSLHLLEVGTVKANLSLSFSCKVDMRIVINTAGQRIILCFQTPGLPCGNLATTAEVAQRKLVDMYVKLNLKRLERIDAEALLWGTGELKGEEDQLKPELFEMWNPLQDSYSVVDPGRRQRWLCIGILVLAFSGIFIIGFIFGWFIKSSSESTNVVTHPGMKKAFLHELKAENIKTFLYNFTRTPHLAGTEHNFELAKQIHAQWKEFGLDSVELSHYDVLLSYPNKTHPNYISIIDEDGNE